MSEGQIAVASAGLQLNSRIVVNDAGQRVHNEVVTIGDSDSNVMAKVIKSCPTTSDYGLVTRNIPCPDSIDTSGKMRTSQITTLFDGKTLNADDLNKWHTLGTGTATFANAMMNMAVTAGQYLIRQSRHFNPYYSGKPQLIEETYDNFINESGVVKRVGYFSSNAVAPYDSNKDGWWVEADGTTYRLIISNNGTVIANIPWTDWLNYDLIKNYDWSKFTVHQVDFLWLGGAGLRLFMKGRHSARRVLL